MPTPSNPTDVERLGHRYQVRLYDDRSARTLVASRVQSFQPSIQQQTEVYYELGSVDPTGAASESPEFRIQLEELVHDVTLDLILAGKAANATTWNLMDFIHDGKLTAYLLERDNSGNVKGELEFSSCVLSEVGYRWQMGQPISAAYTLMGRLGKHWTPGNEPHGSWGAQDTTSPGGIRVKDARLFLGGTTTGYRIYRLQSFSLRTQFPATPIREIGSRALVGWVVEPPRTTLDLDLLAADAQPDDMFFDNYNSPSTTYYDYVNPQTLTAAAIRIYDPDDDEAATVLRSWSIQNLTMQTGAPITAQVRGVATKRYSFLLAKATTANTGGVTGFDGDIV